MAVLPGVSHVSVNVRVAGEIATEYEVPSDQTPIVGADQELSGPVTHCYIEAKTGAEFKIELTVNSVFRFPRLNNAVSISVYIDGTYLSGVYVQDNTLVGRSSRTVVVSDAFCRAEEEGELPCFKKFVFSSITTTETESSEDLASEMERAKGLGVIKVVVVAALTGQRLPRVQVDGIQSQDRELPEKALKGKELSHQGSLAVSTAPPVLECTMLHNQNMLGTIFFHYRSREALQREMIIPRSPSAETQPLAISSPVDANLSNLSEDEIRRLARERLRDLQVKNESGGVKREAESVPRAVRPLKVVKLDDGREAFDLTEDD
ncbi:hypothetical protein CEP54_005789 [Fusarium duplospermum]|uniref:DUF7918 domain-containing protein n=1 Tax=Fusarium duplospermum TaxID=1325734 RepID=A0A428QAM1_9HYPO|nr:hypothetical protein CEP54_005789 [Fusarium duplospermum]